MKQNITVKQLNELSKKSKTNLDRWMSIKTKQPYITESFKSSKYSKYIYLNPLLSIGQMIEFLIDKKEIWRLDVVTLGQLSICDDLWEAVKEVLEK